MKVYHPLSESSEEEHIELKKKIEALQEEQGAEHWLRSKSADKVKTLIGIKTPLVEKKSKNLISTIVNNDDAAVTKEIMKNNSKAENLEEEIDYRTEELEKKSNIGKSKLANTGEETLGLYTHHYSELIYSVGHS